MNTKARFFAKVFSGDKFMGEIEGRNLTVLKQKASKLCNNNYNVFDRMLVLRANGEDLSKALLFIRENIKAPDNTIVRGIWN